MIHSKNIKKRVTGWPKSHYWHARAWYYAVFFSPQQWLANYIIMDWLGVMV